MSGWRGSELTMDAGETATFRLVVRTDDRPGVRAVRLQARSAHGGGWDNTDWRRTATNGRVTLRWTAPSTAETLAIRVQVRRDDSSRAFTSDDRAVVVGAVVPSPAYAQDVLRLTNAARASARTCGGQSFAATGPLSANPRLDAAAAAHATDMAQRNYFSHDSLDGRSPGDRITAAGYRWGGYAENIAAGHTTPAEVVDGWLASPGHCRNLMSPSYTELGVGRATSSSATYGTYWVQDFGVRL